MQQHIENLGLPTAGLTFICSQRDVNETSQIKLICGQYLESPRSYCLYRPKFPLQISIHPNSFRSWVRTGPINLPEIPPLSEIDQRCIPLYEFTAQWIAPCDHRAGTVRTITHRRHRVIFKKLGWHRSHTLAENCSPIGDWSALGPSSELSCWIIFKRFPKMYDRYWEF